MHPPPLLRLRCPLSLSERWILVLLHEGHSVGLPVPKGTDHSCWQSKQVKNLLSAISITPPSILIIFPLTMQSAIFLCAERRIVPNVCLDIPISFAASSWYSPSRSARRIASSSSIVSKTSTKSLPGIEAGLKHRISGENFILLHFVGRDTVYHLQLLAYANNIMQKSLFVNYFRWEPKGTLKRKSSPATGNCLSGCCPYLSQAFLDILQEFKNKHRFTCVFYDAILQ